MPGISSYRFTHKGVENPLQGTRCFGQRSRSVEAFRDKQDREQLAPDPPPMQSMKIFGGDSFRFALLRSNTKARARESVGEEAGNLRPRSCSQDSSAVGIAVGLLNHREVFRMHIQHRRRRR